jgi:RimJ/RimL family protein N-acetyltransferase
MEQPTLYTNRLILRPLRRSDAGAVQKLASAREISDTTLTIPHPYPPEAALDWIHKAESAWRVNAAAIFAITLNETKEFCGGIGLHRTTPDNNAEMGFWVGVPYWNRGLCTEAAEKMLEFGFRTLQLHRIYGRHFPRNVASGRVMLKIGMSYEGHMREHVRKGDNYEDVICYGILRKDWVNRAAPTSVGIGIPPA